MINNIFYFSIILIIFFFQIFIKSKNICYNHNFYIIYNFNFLDNNCIIDYNLISPDFVFQLFQEKTKIFRKNFVECSIDELEDYHNYSSEHFVKYRKIRHILSNKYNSKKDKKDLLNGNISIEQLIGLDKSESLTQD